MHRFPCIINNLQLLQGLDAGLNSRRSQTAEMRMGQVHGYN